MFKNKYKKSTLTNLLSSYGQADDLLARSAIFKQVWGVTAEDFNVMTVYNR